MQLLKVGGRWKIASEFFTGLEPGATVNDTMRYEASQHANRTAKGTR